jgi:hypothetical protein
MMEISFYRLKSTTGQNGCKEKRRAIFALLYETRCIIIPIGAAETRGARTLLDQGFIARSTSPIPTGTDWLILPDPGRDVAEYPIRQSHSDV